MHITIRQTKITGLSVIFALILEKGCHLLKKMLLNQINYIKLSFTLNRY